MEVRAHPRRKPRGGIAPVRRHYRMAFLKGEEDAKLLGYRTSSQRLVMMPPEEYLRLVGMGLSDAWIVKDVATDPDYIKLRERMERGEPIDAPWLDVDYQTGLVRTQEGRHRAQIAMKLGIPEIPVILYHVDERGKTVPIRRDLFHSHDTWETPTYTRLRARGEGP